MSGLRNLENLVSKDLQERGFNPTVKDIENVVSDLLYYFAEFHSDDLADMAEDAFKEAQDNLTWVSDLLPTSPEAKIKAGGGAKS